MRTCLKMSKTVTLLAPLALIAWVGCTPTTGSDAGTDDAGESADGGEHHADAGHDAGNNNPPPTDSGPPSGECPAIGPLSDPTGQPCSEEGLVCRESGCFAPGPSCLFIECRDGYWVNQALLEDDAGPTGDDAGPTEDDAGSGADDAGDGDAGDAG